MTENCRDQTNSLVLTKKSAFHREAFQNIHTLLIFCPVALHRPERREMINKEHGRSSMNKRMGCFQAYLGAENMLLPLHDIRHQLNEKFPSALNLSHQLANGSIVLVVSYIWQPVLPHLICLSGDSNWNHSHD